ncbi:metal-dependent hydrolase [Alkalicoccus urumqiensis]|uniref:metal-dependent hydrolase n=1 Tax=Alkalicoccus urumqiensis TaxID=1548213 RepID=UPI0015E5C0BD|nr:metal-dependent hydrolase [Alkalicoccus urumqiensis]
MNTVHHAAWTYIAGKISIPERKAGVRWATAGAVMPDVSYVVLFFGMGVERGTLHAGMLLSADAPSRWELHELVHAIFEHPLGILLRNSAHSLVFWAGAALLFWLLTRTLLSNAMLFVWGWLGHILLDALTHVTDATPLFYPFSEWTFPAFVSYWDPAYYGPLFSLVSNLLLLACGTFLVLRHYLRRKRPSE